MMVEYGEHFWGGEWDSLYSVFGGNPLAAMPSLALRDVADGDVAARGRRSASGFAGGAYTATLGLSLVYLGEHYASTCRGRSARRTPCDDPSRRLQTPWKASGVPWRISVGTPMELADQLEAELGALAGRRRPNAERVADAASARPLLCLHRACRRLHVSRAASCCGRRRDAALARPAGNAWWIAAALLFEVGSYAGYVVLFRPSSLRESPRSISSRAIG